MSTPDVRTARIAQLVAVLTVLHAGLPLVVDDLLAGQATEKHLNELADRFEQVARQLRRTDVALSHATDGTK